MSGREIDARPSADPVALLLGPENLRHLASICRDDADGIMADLVRERFAESGLLTALGLAYSPPAPASMGEFPLNWSAYQLGLFDNGQQRDKRGRPFATRTQFALDIKVWAGSDPNFKSVPEWQATCNLWSRDFALKHVGALAKRGSISKEFATDVCIPLLEAIDESWLFGIPFLRQIGSGSRYDNEHFCAVKFSHACPSQAMMFIHGTAVQIEEFSDIDASGKPLIKAIGAARISRSPLPFWETQTLAAEPNSY